MKESQVSLSYPLLGLTGRPVEEEEVNWRSLPGRGPVQQGSVTFGYSVCYRCRGAGSLRH